MITLCCVKWKTSNTKTDERRRPRHAELQEVKANTCQTCGKINNSKNLPRDIERDREKCMPPMRFVSDTKRTTLGRSRGKCLYLLMANDWYVVLLWICLEFSPSMISNIKMSMEIQCCGQPIYRFRNIEHSKIIETNYKVISSMCTIWSTWNHLNVCVRIYNLTRNQTMIWYDNNWHCLDEANNSPT